MSTQSVPIVLSFSEWDTSKVKFMQPKINERGAKSINIISAQTNRSLHVSTPLLKTWGISDFVDEKGDADGKFKMSLRFPNADYDTPATREFLEKLKAFESQIIDAAVKNSELWFGKSKTREVVEDNFFPFIKYPKDKVTKNTDMTKAPTVSVKVPNYNGRWSVQVYDTKQNRLFPSENENHTPLDFVPKDSTVACVLQCGGLWFGGKGWGVTWKLNQVVVKPMEVSSVYDRCYVQLSTDEIQTLNSQSAVKPEPSAEEPQEEEEEEEPVQQTSTTVPDSDDEAEAEEAEPAVETTTTPTPVKKVVKKVAVPEPAAVAVASAPEPVKKKVIKKKV
jgi:hypothetical protein